MATQEHAQPAVSQELSDLVLRWRDLQRQGQTPAAEEICSGHPELLGELQRHIRAIESMEALLGRPDEQETPIKESWQPDLADDMSAAPLPQIPGYELIHVLGQGGMGIVYKARQISLKRFVALKMISAGAGARPEQQARFRTEAQAAAELRHPNIVQIYEIGDWQGRPFFSMELVEGDNLAQKMAGTVLPARQAAQLLAVLAEAVAAAHERGIIHRDLKPANVLLQTQDSQSAISNLQSSIPKITDFGLAKRLQSDSDLPAVARATHSGAILGTFSYMAPEQAEGKTREVGPAVDIYALGAILYEMLTGRPPFQGESPLDTLEQVRHLEPVPPRRLQPKLPRDLETICLKCLRKHPLGRYPSAKALGGDLHAFLAGQPIQARPIRFWEKAVKWAKRKPAMAALAAVILVASASLLTGWAYFTALLHTEREHARQQQLLAEEERDEALAQRARAQALLRIVHTSVDEFSSTFISGKIESLLTNDPGFLPYSLARYYARASSAYQQAPELALGERTQLASQCAKRAVNLVELAHELDYFRKQPARRLTLLAQDKDLAVLGSRPDFSRLIDRLQAETGVKAR